MRRALVELARIGFVQSTDISGKLDAGSLHSQTDSKIWNLFLPRVTDGVQHSCDAALAKAAGNQDAVVIFELRFVRSVFWIATLQPLSFHPGDVQLQALPHSTVGESFFQRLVR